MRKVLNHAFVLLIALTFVLIGPSAYAHVLIEAVEPEDDGKVEIVFAFDHSCDDSLTSALEITVPAGSSVLSGAGPEGWESAVSGNTIRFAGPGIPGGPEARFMVTATLEGSIGQTLLFPTEQICQDGSRYSWIDGDEADPRPAPRIVATAATLSGAAESGEQQSSGASNWATFFAIAGFALAVAAFTRFYASKK